MHIAAVIVSHTGRPVYRRERPCRSRERGVCRGDPFWPGTGILTPRQDEFAFRPDGRNRPRARYTSWTISAVRIAVSVIMGRKVSA